MDPKRRRIPGVSHGNIAVREDQTPPDPALVELVKYLGRGAARQWFEQQMRGKGE
jgi:hypothetical protein